MPDTTVKVFQNITGTDSGVPQLSGTAGALITVLDACLVNGYGSVTLDSLVVASNVATCTKSTGHGFTAIGTTGPVIRVSGATPSGLNADWRITVVSSTVFTFVTTGISDQTATGTIAAKRAPAGFSKAFSGTNKAAYRSDDVTGTRLYLRIDDTGTTTARCCGYESMDDVDTVTPGYGLFPTAAQLSGGGYILKSSATVAWNLFADSRGFYLAINDQTWQSITHFGDFVSYVSAGDAFGCGLCTHTSTSITTQQLNQFGAAAGWIARTYTQLGTSVVRNHYSHKISGFVGASGQASLAPVDNGVHFWPIEVWEGTTLARGMMPGMWNPIHNNNLTHGATIDSISALPGRELFIQSIRSGQMAIDITGPWR